ncbi:amidophosphoribosyltransferase [Flammeovirga kamogawensis]|uniref:Amidophosphoribosyltransferase n=1 Tax=Flammeovirga kamogawensis TaxID=373891 RepID=A0ABX8GW92_9BACT|nr:amidophosphoribosyltransferase [Flammeovirga kamogawensis]QWG07452.1 amidophosphoribosyltransferase [Flammeovirga kamogawensis]TRX69264.1 amidophosphoribosyltransferase [Flammeovirga kamogawensis]
MSEVIKHECGIAMLRLRKPLSYFIEKYGTPTYAISKMYLLMEKQRNRGQDGAGIASIKLDLEPGFPFVDRARSVEADPINDIFKKVGKKLNKISKDNTKYFDADYLRQNIPFMGDVYMGHLRYGTHGKNTIAHCHPFMRNNNWRSRQLIMAGNFNMTNVDELFDKLVHLGQHPKENVDTVTVMEKIGHFLDLEVQDLFQKNNNAGLTNIEISNKIEEELDLCKVLTRSCKDFDGGYAIMGLTGYGGSFVARDVNGIRPAYYYADDEIVVVASEKTAIKTAFNADYDLIKEIKPGHALIVNKDSSYEEKEYLKPQEKLSCSFERIYFSRGTDPAIYEERKKLGELLVPKVLKALDYDLENTVFSYIPNTAETAFLGMMAGMDKYLVKKRLEAIENGVSGEELEKMMTFRPRQEKLVIKDVKARTFIADDTMRDDMVAHVYDTTYEVIKKKVDTLVVIDDSIVRGTTLEKSIIQMLDRLEPKRIIVVSSAPQIRYPDCYGINMSKMKEFVAFRAMINLVKKRNMEELLDEVYYRSKSILRKDVIDENLVQTLYNQFSDEEISQEIAEIIKLDHIKADVEVIYQTVDNLHEACPHHLGDWYFTGNFPTNGGMKVANQAFVNYMEGKEVRAY